MLKTNAFHTIVQFHVIVYFVMLGLSEGSVTGVPPCPDDPGQIHRSIEDSESTSLSA